MFLNIPVVFYHIFHPFRDYKQEYEKLKAEKKLDVVKKTEERLSKIQVQGPGTTVEMNSLVTQVSNVAIHPTVFRFIKFKKIFSGSK